MHARASQARIVLFSQKVGQRTAGVQPTFLKLGCMH